jgi:hypothetical protein
MELRHLHPEQLQRAHEDVGTLDELRLVPLVPADTVFLERADDDRLPREAESPPRCSTLVVASEWEVLEVDADRDAMYALRRHSCFEDELVHLRVRYLDPVETPRTAAQRRERCVELGGVRRPRSPV